MKKIIVLFNLPDWTLKQYDEVWKDLRAQVMQILKGFYTMPVDCKEITW